MPHNPVGCTHTPCVAAHHPTHHRTTGSSGSTSHGAAAPGNGAARTCAAAADSNRVTGLPSWLLPLLLLLLNKPPQAGLDSMYASPPWPAQQVWQQQMVLTRVLGCSRDSR
jgi:hypothetical protein